MTPVGGCPVASPVASSGHTRSACVVDLGVASPARNVLLSMWSDSRPVSRGRAEGSSVRVLVIQMCRESGSEVGGGWCPIASSNRRRLSSCNYLYPARNGDEGGAQ